MIKYSDSQRTHHQIVEDTSADVSYNLTGLTVNMPYNISVQVGMTTEYGYVFSNPSESVKAVSTPTSRRF